MKNLKLEVVSVHEVSRTRFELVVESLEGPNAGLRLTAFFSTPTRRLELKKLLRPSSRVVTIGLPEDSFEGVRAVVEEAVAGYLRRNECRPAALK